MQNFYQKFTSFFDLSSFLQEKEKTVLTSSFQTYKKDAFLPQNRQDFLSNNAQLNFSTSSKKKSLRQEELQQNLQKKIYLVVTKSTTKKLNGNVLLLLTSQDRLKAEKVLTTRAHKTYSFHGKAITRPYAKSWRNKSFYANPLDTKSRKKQNITKSISNRAHRLGQNFYYNNKEGGYKSICPVFFDSKSAQQFLQSMIAKQQNFHNGLPLEKAKKSLNNVFSSQIISLSLEEFLDFFSSNPENKSLDKVEFLFFPVMENMDKKSFLPSFHKNLVFLKDRETENFKTYQQKYYSNHFPSFNNLSSLQQENKI